VVCVHTVVVTPLAIGGSFCASLRRNDQDFHLHSFVVTQQHAP